MKTLKTLMIACLLFVSGFCSIFFITGCSGASNDQKERDKEFLEMTELVYDLNHMAGLYRNDGSGINYDGDSNGYVVYVGSGLEKYLDSICENFTKSNDYSLIVTSSQVRTALEDDFDETLKDYESDNWKSNFLYKLFYWLGQPCKDTAVYVNESGVDRKECEELISSGYFYNYNVVAGQINKAEQGEISPYKFKWQ